RFWYRKASELGSEEAQQRLRLLVSANGGVPAVNGRADSARNAQSQPKKKDAAIATDTAAKRRGVRQLSPIEVLRADPDDAAQDRASADPDPSIRPKLLGREPLIQAMGQ